MPDTVTMDKVVSLSRRRGFVFPSSEIYGGLGSSYDYGHYGVLLKENVKARWLEAMVQERDDIVALDSAIKLASQVPHEALASAPILQGFLVVPYWAMVRFEEWDRILDDKGPQHETAFTRGAWRYALVAAGLIAVVVRGQLRLAAAERARTGTRLLA